MHKPATADPVAVPATPVRVQPKLMVGAANDSYEREADDIAAHVVAALRGDITESASVGDVQRAGGGAGFEAPDSVQRGVAAARGSGSALPAGLQAQMGGAMDADLSGVRIHTGGGAAQMATDISARAFTTGNDVFFNKGEYNPGSPAGQQVLAHELTHTVQQGGSAGAAQRIQRLEVRGTDWNKVEAVTVFSGGATGGVAKFDDGVKPVVVKVGNPQGDENVLASAALKAVSPEPAKKKKGLFGRKKKTSKVTMSAPGSRVAAPKELSKIKKAATGNMVQSDRTAGFMTRLNAGENDTLIMEYGGGVDATDELQQSQTKKGALGKRKLDPNSMMGSLIKNKSAMTTLGRIAVADGFIGHGDRFLGLWNPENFKWDRDNMQFVLTDNTQRSDSGMISNWERDGKIFDQGGEAGFKQWAASHGKRVAEPALQRMASKVVETVADGVTGNWEGGMVNKKDRALVKKAWNKAVPKITKNVAMGGIAGRSQLLAAMSNPVAFAEGTSGGSKDQVIAGVVARREFIAGASEKDAWATAEGAARGYLGTTREDWDIVLGFFEQNSGIIGGTLQSLLDVNHDFEGECDYPTLYAALSGSDREARITQILNVSGLSQEEFEYLAPGLFMDALI